MYRNRKGLSPRRKDAKFIRIDYLCEKNFLSQNAYSFILSRYASTKSVSVEVALAGQAVLQ
jgi:hypothetical protein